MRLADAGKVTVALDESGNHQLALNVDHLRRGPDVSPYIGRAADRDDPIATNCHRLRRRKRIIDGDHFAVGDNEIGRLLRGPVRSWIATIAAYIRDGQAAGRHFDDVDPEAYLVHCLYFVIASAAAAPLIHGAVEPGAVGRERLDGELGRFAKAALFVPRSTKRTRKR